MAVEAWKAVLTAGLTHRPTTSEGECPLGLFPYPAHVGKGRKKRTTEGKMVCLCWRRSKPPTTKKKQKKQKQNKKQKPKENNNNNNKKKPPTYLWASDSTLPLPTKYSITLQLLDIISPEHELEFLTDGMGWRVTAMSICQDFAILSSKSICCIMLFCIWKVTIL